MFWPMFSTVNTKDAAAVEREVEAIYLALFPQSSARFAASAFQWVVDAFEGRYRDYLPIDAKYHDLEHTMQGTLCMARLLDARQRVGGRPSLSQRMFELGLLAILLHDTGYLKQRGDTGGTGAKYTLTHVARSVRFAEELLLEKGLPLAEIRSVQNMIRCTGVHVDIPRIPFQSELERFVGFCLGTADLLGQMAADDYVDKLPTLYTEFEESVRFYDGKMALNFDFKSAADLQRHTPTFWRDFVLPKLNTEFWGMYKFLNQPYPSGPNEYIQRIEANVARVQQKLTAAPRS